MITTKLIDEPPLRIQRFRMLVMQFNIYSEHVPGKVFYTADALSQGPGMSSPEKESDLDQISLLTLSW